MLTNYPYIQCMSFSPEDRVENSVFLSKVTSRDTRNSFVGGW